MRYTHSLQSAATALVGMALLTTTVACAAVAGETGPAVPDNPPAFTETDRGLRYRVLREGKGAVPAAEDTVTVHYKGWLDNGQEFDSSYRRKKPTTFRLNQVIPGWTEGMQLVGEGGLIELEIPADLGYGARGAGGAIPPNARLHFLVELIEVVPAND